MNKWAIYLEIVKDEKQDEKIYMFNTKDEAILKLVGLYEDFFNASPDYVGVEFIPNQLTAYSEGDGARFYVSVMKVEGVNQMTTKGKTR